MSLFKNYIEEITDREVIENNKFFVHYNIHKGVFFIRDMYVIPEFRDGYTCFSLWKSVFRICRERNCDLVSGYVHINNPNLKEMLTFCNKRGSIIHELKDDKFMITLDYRG